MPEVEAVARVPADDMLALDEVLTAFAQLEPRKAELVKLRYFAGLTLEEAIASAWHFTGNGGSILGIRPRLAF